jgi:hypothetical protein
VLENIKKCHSTIKIIVLSHYTDELCVDRCKRAGADYFFDKSFQLMQLKEILWKWAHTDRLDNKFRIGNQFSVSIPDEGMGIDVGNHNRVSAVM